MVRFGFVIWFLYSVKYLMKFLSAQPDEQYFLWQLQVQIANFAALNIEDRMIILIATKGEPSKLAQLIAAHTKGQVYFIPDGREDTSYPPSIQFFLYSKFFEENRIGGRYMLVDSDVVFTSLEPWMTGDQFCDEGDRTIYMSDTRNYLGYEYLVSKGETQLKTLASIVGLPVDMIRDNDPGTGGAQTLMVGFEDPKFWKKVEIDAVTMYKYMTAMEPHWNKPGYPIQRWTAGMWALLWNIWLTGTKTQCPRELDFAWGTDKWVDHSGQCGGKSVLHLAGVTASMADSHFFKGKYILNSPFEDMDSISALKERHTSSNETAHTITNMSIVYIDYVISAKDYWDECIL